MADFVMPGCAQDNDACLREAVCVHTRKIFDSCRDKDCAEDLRFYPAQGCQEVIDKAISPAPPSCCMSTLTWSRWALTAATTP